jgi:perosamine synthetase
MSKTTGPTPTSCEPGAAPATGLPLCVPFMAGNEWTYVKECLDTNFVSSVGPFVERFERELAERVGARFGVATSSGTAALHVALLVAGVQPDDEVLVSTLTFIAPVNTIRYVGAWPVLMDADPDYWQMDVDKVATFLDRECASEGGVLRNRATGRRVRAILPVHVLGHPCDMDRLLELADRYDLQVVEDATESLGARYRHRPVGSLGPLACFSFNGNKIMTTGGGGMIVTQDETLARKAKYLTTQAKDDPVEYIHNETGYNYRLTNIQAALGCAQLEQLDDFVRAKRETAASYLAELADVPGLSLLREAPWAESNCWMSTLLVDEHRFGMDSRRLMRTLAAHQVQSRPLWCPMHRLPPFRAAQTYRITEADRLYRDALSLPSSVGLRRQDIHQVVARIAAAPGSHIG